MNNQPKVLLTIEGIEGATLHSKGTKKIKFIIRKKDLYNKPYKGKVIIDDTLKAAIDAYYVQYGAK